MKFAVYSIDYFCFFDSPIFFLFPFFFLCLPYFVGSCGFHLSPTPTCLGLEGFVVVVVIP
uniref:Uncharacterized protein n=1 Tax=Arundo donax TaxID=35708 RepID=A0A0A8YNA3_ARUDO